MHRVSVTLASFKELCHCAQRMLCAPNARPPCSPRWDCAGHPQITELRNYGITDPCMHLLPPRLAGFLTPAALQLTCTTAHSLPLSCLITVGNSPQRPAPATQRICLHAPAQPGVLLCSCAPPFNIRTPLQLVLPPEVLERRWLHLARSYTGFSLLSRVLRAAECTLQCPTCACWTR